MLTLCANSVCGDIPGEDGASQMALEDLAMFRAIPTATVFYPSDGVSTEKAVELAANTKVLIILSICYICCTVHKAWNEHLLACQLQDQNLQLAKNFVNLSKSQYYWENISHIKTGLGQMRRQMNTYSNWKGMNCSFLAKLNKCICIF